MNIERATTFLAKIVEWKTLRTHVFGLYQAFGRTGQKCYLFDSIVNAINYVEG